jgi:uroporphyrinogen III methyltransferase/synthase
MLAGGTDCIAFTSSSTVHNMARLFDTENLSATLNGVVIACIGDVTATTAQEYGLEVNVQPQQATITSLSRAIADFFCQKDSAGVATESG